MSVTDEELERERARTTELREQIAEANSKAAENTAATARQLEFEQVKAENARLEAELKRAEAVVERSEDDEGTTTPLGQVREQLAVAQAAAEQPVGPVDTNVDSEGNPLGSRDEDDDDTDKE